RDAVLARGICGARLHADRPPELPLGDLHSQSLGSVVPSRVHFSKASPADLLRDPWMLRIFRPIAPRMRFMDLPSACSNNAQRLTHVSRLAASFSKGRIETEHVWTPLQSKRNGKRGSAHQVMESSARGSPHAPAWLSCNASCAERAFMPCELTHRPSTMLQQRPGCAGLPRLVPASPVLVESQRPSRFPTQYWECAHSAVR
ncbi:hypothetical protein B0J12DRAFT_756960, partial [Macrophomina phaseolina]